MANFCYKAISAKGKTVRGLVEADTERQAIASVREKGLVPLSVESASASVANPGMPSSKSSFKKILESLHPVPKTAVAAMARQLATLLHAGLPLDEALASICAHDDASRMQGIVSRLRDRIMAGGDLADGLAEFPNVFSSTFVTMVRAGEASGTLELVIERFAEHIEQQVALVRKVQATLAYPILMLFVSDKAEAGEGEGSGDGVAAGQHHRVVEMRRSCWPSATASDPAGGSSCSSSSAS